MEEHPRAQLTQALLHRTVAYTVSHLLVLEPDKPTASGLGRAPGRNHVWKDEEVPQKKARRTSHRKLTCCDCCVAIVALPRHSMLKAESGKLT